MSRTRSVLVLIADDWSPLAGCYGNPVIHTPNVDALAARGERFSHAFCTTPSCAASRASLLTGLYSHTHGQYGHSHGVHNFHTQSQVRSIPRVLRDNGLATGVVGKLHVQPPEVYPWDFAPPVNGRDVQQLAARAEEFLTTCGDRPFYLHVGFGDPHRDFGNARPYPGVTEVRYAPDEVVVPPFLPDIPAVRAELAQYYQSISRLDTGIGMVLAALERSGRAGETLVLCLSDHGMPFPGAKASPFDSGHHCPLIVRHPETGHGGGVNDALVNWCNIAPTVFDWCGVQAPDGLPERSFLPILGQPHPEGWDETYFSHTFHEVTNYFPYRVLRGRRYKYVRTLFPELTMPLPSDLWASPTWRAVRDRGITMLGRRPTLRCLHHDAEALFDLDLDPVEAENRIGDPTLTGIAAQMRAKVQAFRQVTRDPWILASEQAGEVFEPRVPASGLPGGRRLER